MVFGEGEGGFTVAAASPSSLVGPPSSTDPSTDPLDDAFEAQRIDDPLYEGFIEPAGGIEAGGIDGFLPWTQFIRSCRIASSLIISRVRSHVSTLWMNLEEKRGCLV